MDPRLRFFFVRESADKTTRKFVPLIPADLLPDWIDFAGMPHYISIDQAQSMVNVGIFPMEDRDATTGAKLGVLKVNSMSLPITNMSKLDGGVDVDGCVTGVEACGTSKHASGTITTGEGPMAALTLEDGSGGAVTVDMVAPPSPAASVDGTTIVVPNNQSTSSKHSSNIGSTGNSSAVCPTPAKQRKAGNTLGYQHAARRKDGCANSVGQQQQQQQQNHYSHQHYHQENQQQHIQHRTNSAKPGITTDNVDVTSIDKSETRENGISYFCRHWCWHGT